MEKKISEPRILELATINNPGWVLRSVGTPSSEKRTEISRINRSELDWIDCWMEGESFSSFGGVYNLKEMVQEYGKIFSAEPFSANLAKKLESWLGRFQIAPEWYHSNGFELMQTRNRVAISVCLEFLDWQEMQKDIHLFFDLKTDYEYLFDKNLQLEIIRKDGDIDLAIQDFLNLFENIKIESHK